MDRRGRVEERLGKDKRRGGEGKATFRKYESQRRQAMLIPIDCLYHTN